MFLDLCLGLVGVKRLGMVSRFGLSVLARTRKVVGEARDPVALSVMLDFSIAYVLMGDFAGQETEEMMLTMLYG